MSITCGRCEMSTVTKLCSECVNKKSTAQVAYCDSCWNLDHVDHPAHVFIPWAPGMKEECKKTLEQQKRIVAQMKVTARETERLGKDFKNELKLKDRLIRSTTVDFQTLLKHTAMSLIKQLEAKESLLQIEIRSWMDYLTSESKAAEQLIEDIENCLVLDDDKFLESGIQDVEAELFEHLKNVKAASVPSTDKFDMRIDYEPVTSAIKGLGFNLPAVEEELELVGSNISEESEMEVFIGSNVSKNGIFYALPAFTADTALKLRQISAFIRRELINDKTWLSLKLSGTEPSIGMAVFVLNPTDAIWYRGVVEETRQSRYSVRLVDYGNLLTVDSDALLPVKKDLLPNCASQAIQCCILPNLNTELSLNAKWHFGDTLKNATARCRFNRLLAAERESVWYVTLFVATFGSDTVERNVNEEIEKILDDAKSKNDSIQCRDIRFKTQEQGQESISSGAVEPSPVSSSQSLSSSLLSTAREFTPGQGRALVAPPLAKSQLSSSPDSVTEKRKAFIRGDYSTYTCNNCNEYGHIARHCPGRTSKKINYVQPVDSASQASSQIVSSSNQPTVPNTSVNIILPMEFPFESASIQMKKTGSPLTRNAELTADEMSELVSILEESRTRPLQCLANDMSRPPPSLLQSSLNSVSDANSTSLAESHPKFSNYDSSDPLNMIDHPATSTSPLPADPPLHELLKLSQMAAISSGMRHQLPSAFSHSSVVENYARPESDGLSNSPHRSLSAEAKVFSPPETYEQAAYNFHSNAAALAQQQKLLSMALSTAVTSSYTVPPPSFSSPPPPFSSLQPFVSGASIQENLTIFKSPGVQHLHAERMNANSRSPGEERHGKSMVMLNTELPVMNRPYSQDGCQFSSENHAMNLPIPDSSYLVQGFQLGESQCANVSYSQFPPGNAVQLPASSAPSALYDPTIFKSQDWRLQVEHRQLPLLSQQLPFVGREGLFPADAIIVSTSGVEAGHSIHSEHFRPELHQQTSFLQGNRTEQVVIGSHLSPPDVSRCLSFDARSCYTHENNSTIEQPLVHAAEETKFVQPGNATMFLPVNSHGGGTYYVDSPHGSGAMISSPIYLPPTPDQDMAIYPSQVDYVGVPPGRDQIWPCMPMPHMTGNLGRGSSMTASEGSSNNTFASSDPLHFPNTQRSQNGESFERLSFFVDDQVGQFSSNTQSVKANECEFVEAADSTQMFENHGLLKGSVFQGLVMGGLSVNGEFFMQLKRSETVDQEWIELNKILKLISTAVEFNFVMARDCDLMLKSKDAYMSKDISKYSPHLQPSDIQIDHVVVAKCNRGDAVVRARVTGLKPGKVCLFQIDYGRLFEAPLEAVFPLPAKLRTMPPQVILCSVAVSDHNQFSASAQQLFTEITKEQLLIAHIFFVQSGPVVTKYYVTMTNDVGQSINQSLYAVRESQTSACYRQDHSSSTVIQLAPTGSQEFLTGETYDEHAGVGDHKRQDDHKFENARRQLYDDKLESSDKSGYLLSEKSRTVPSSGLVCFNCNEVGHRQNNCPLLRLKGLHTANSGGKECARCGDQGYGAHDCPNFKREGNRTTKHGGNGDLSEQTGMDKESPKKPYQDKGKAKTKSSKSSRNKRHN